MKHIDFFKDIKSNRLEQKRKAATKKLKNYLNEKQFKLENLKVEDLIQADNILDINNYHVKVHEKCPEQIKNIVLDFILEEFPRP